MVTMGPARPHWKFPTLGANGSVPVERAISRGLLDEGSGMPLTLDSRLPTRGMRNHGERVDPESAGRQPARAVGAGRQAGGRGKCGEHGMERVNYKQGRVFTVRSDTTGRPQAKKNRVLGGLTTSGAITCRRRAQVGVLRL